MNRNGIWEVRFFFLFRFFSVFFYFRVVGFFVSRLDFGIRDNLWVGVGD